MTEVPGAEIDRLRGDDGGLSRDAIRRILPYGDSFLFLDQVSSLDRESIEATYEVPTDSPWLVDHFEGFPVMPAALMAEGFSQAASLLVRYNLQEPTDKDILALKIERGAFAAPVFPGDEVQFSPRLLRIDSRAARLEGEARAAGKRVASFRIVLAIVDRRAFRQSGASGEQR